MSFGQSSEVVFCFFVFVRRICFGKKLGNHSKARLWYAPPELCWAKSAKCCVLSGEL